MKTASSTQKTVVRSQNGAKTTKSIVAATAGAGLKTMNRRKRSEPRAEFGAARRPCHATAGGGGKRWGGKWVQPGKGGKKVSRWTSFFHFETGFSHLSPANSTQVVDFPRIYAVRVFWKEGFHSSAESLRGQHSEDTDAQRVRYYAKNLSAFIASFHVLSGIIAQNRPVLSHFLAFYRSELFSKRSLEPILEGSGGRNSGREKSTKVRIVARKFAQIRAVVTRLFGFLHPRLYFQPRMKHRLNTDAERTLNGREQGKRSQAEPETNIGKATEKCHG